MYMIYLHTCTGGFFQSGHDTQSTGAMGSPWAWGTCLASWPYWIRGPPVSCKRFGRQFGRPSPPKEEIYHARGTERREAREAERQVVCKSYEEEIERKKRASISLRKWDRTKESERVSKTEQVRAKLIARQHKQSAHEHKGARESEQERKSETECKRVRERARERVREQESVRKSAQSSARSRQIERERQKEQKSVSPKAMKLTAHHTISISLSLSLAHSSRSLALRLLSFFSFSSLSLLTLCIQGIFSIFVSCSSCAFPFVCISLFRIRSLFLCHFPANYVCREECTHSLKHTPSLSLHVSLYLNFALLRSLARYLSRSVSLSICCSVSLSLFNFIFLSLVLFLSLYLSLFLSTFLSLSLTLPFSFCLSHMHVHALSLQHIFTRMSVLSLNLLSIHHPPLRLINPSPLTHIYHIHTHHAYICSR